jgi:hypothetical protein
MAGHIGGSGGTEKYGYSFNVIQIADAVQGNHIEQAFVFLISYNSPLENE